MILNRSIERFFRMKEQRRVGNGRPSLFRHGSFPVPVCTLLALALALLCPGCGKEASTDASGLSVTVSIAPQAYLVERIGAPHVQPLTLVHPGESPHSYQPSDRQVSRVMQSQAIFQMGVPFERGKWFKAIEQSGKTIPLTDMREGVTLRPIDAPCGEDHGSHDHAHCIDEAGTGHDEHAHEGLDPHIWLAPGLLKIQARTVARVLQELDPDHTEVFQENLDSFLAELDELDMEIEQVLAPCAGRSLFVYHPAWGYFCDAYGLEQVAIEFEGKEPSDEELTRLQERLRAEGARVIFVQPQIAGSSARAIAQALDVEIRTLDPLARDVVENLREVAKAIAASYE
jgi:zinc transport system substrate-binding protein